MCIPLALCTERVGKPTASFWRTGSNSVELKCSLSKWLSLANIALMQVPGSVEEEQCRIG